MKRERNVDLGSRGMKEHKYYIYILTNKRNGALYVGVTNSLLRRVEEHKRKEVEGFTKKYGTDRLVYFEIYQDVGKALYREKQLKAWERSWKIELIEKENSVWRDLYDDLLK